MHQSLKSVLLVVFLVSLASCGKKESASGNASYPATFSEIRDKVLMPSCGRCHPTLESYEGTLKYVRKGDAAASPLYREVKGGDMPPNGSDLIDEQVEAIRVWIDAGAAND